ncbi:MAG: beta strand repeat-containing protein [bacterium]
MATSISPIDSEVNALFLGLFDRPAAPSGQAYWADQLSLNPTNPIAALDSISTFVNSGAAFTNATIGAEITSIFDNLLGRAPLPGGLDYWSSQYIDTGGTQTIGQIAVDIYNITTTKPISQPYPFDTLTMNDKLSAMQTFTTNYTVDNQLNGPASYASATSYLNNAITQANVQNSTLPTNINGAQNVNVPAATAVIGTDTNASPKYLAASGNYSFIGGTAGADTINLGGPPSSVYTYSIAGGTGANTVDVNYAGVTAADLTTYLGSASGFETLDFTVTATPGALDLAKVDAGGFTAVDINGGTFTFNNATNADTFNVNATTASLTISDATGQTTANVDLNGGTADVTLTTLDALNPTITDIYSNGTTANTISTLDVANNSTVNFYGSDNLTITNPVTATGITYDFANFGGTSLTINGVQEINPGGSTAASAVTLTQGSVSTYGNGNYNFTIADTAATGTTLTAGNGTDSVTVTGSSTGGNIITLGTGADTIHSSATGNDTIVIGSTATEYTNTNAVSLDYTGASGNNGITISGSGNDTVNLSVNNGNSPGITITGNGNDTVSVGNGANDITITNTSASATDIVTVGNGTNTIALGGTVGTDTISIGYGANPITLGTGADSLNLVPIYSTTSNADAVATVTNVNATIGANILSGVISGDTLVFNHSADTITPPILLTATLGTEGTFGGVAGVTSPTTAISDLQAATYDGAVAGNTSVGWFTNGADTWVIMDHNTGGTVSSTTTATFVDQVIEITGAAPTGFASGDVVSLNSAHLVSVAL